MQNKMHFRRLIGLLFVAALFLTACGYIGSEGIDVDKIPKQYNVDTGSTFYTTNQIPFTGDPDTDFGTNFLFATDGAGDLDVYADGPAPDDALTNRADIRKIYVAYSDTGLYVGIKMDDNPADYSSYQIALLMIIDNNVTNGPGSTGLNTFDAGGMVNAGLSGSWGLDNPGVEISTNHGKASFFLKHWRNAAGEQWKPFYFWNGTQDPLNTVPMGENFEGQLTVYPPNGISTSVTEAYIPWKYIFGDALGDPQTDIPSTSIKLWFATTPTLAVSGYVDTYPDNVGPYAEWLELTTAGEWATLNIR